VTATAVSAFEVRHDRGPTRAMDCAVDPTAADQGAVRRVDDRVGRDSGDVALDELNRCVRFAHRWSSGAKSLTHSHGNLAITANTWLKGVTSRRGNC
jgi:hypothetical protein